MAHTRDVVGGHNTDDLIDATIGHHGRKIATGKQIEQTNTGDVNVTFNADEEDRSQVRLALLEWNMRRTQRSQDVWSYAVIALAVVYLANILINTKAYGDLRTDILAQNNRMEQRIIRLEEEIRYMQRQLDRDRGQSFFVPSDAEVRP